ncbi:hypothetical protein HDZ31DRAFT_33284 [Schizophyllum fasciatum]
MATQSNAPSQLNQLIRQAIASKREKSPLSREVLNQIARLLRSDKALSALDVNPFALGELESGVVSMQVPAVSDALSTLDVLGLLFDFIITNEYPALTHALAVCFRARYSSLVHWLVFLFPAHGFVNVSSRVGGTYLTIARILALLFRLKEPLAAEIPQQPRIHELALKLWLQKGTHDATAPRKHIDDLHRTVVALLAIALGLDGSLASALDPAAIDAALAVGHQRPRRFLRRAVRAIARLLDADINPLLVTNYTNFLILITGAPRLAMRNPARDVVREVVDLMRRLHARREVQGWEGAARMTCTVLHTMWYREDGTRALSWALRDGVLPLLLEMYQHQQEQVILQSVVYIAVRTVRVSVVRAVKAGGHYMPFENAKIPIGAATALQDYFVERLTLLRQDWRRSCGYRECPVRGQVDRLTIHWCPCYRRRYCSKSCQRSDWRNHKSQCHDHPYKASPLNAILDGELSAPDAQFAMLCLDAYMGKHALSILAEARRLRASASPFPPLYNVEVDLRRVPGTHTVIVSQGEPVFREPMVFVAGRVYSAQGEYDSPPSGRLSGKSGRSAMINGLLAPLETLKKIAALDRGLKLDPTAGPCRCEACAPFKDASGYNVPRTQL